ncbi:hypothetical protein ACFOY2_31560 [Nonomuraea purpurea]|uniref:Uncharacterized protein n=1 Tax=Nonomuraea purpurea TaxID=1849276 RepID=A0ABV8GFL7_9ACTN
MDDQPTLDGPHPAPDILSYIDDLIANLVDDDMRTWSDSLDYGTDFTV